LRSDILADFQGQRPGSRASGPHHLTILVGLLLFPNLPILTNRIAGPWSYPAPWIIRTIMRGLTCAQTRPNIYPARSRITAADSWTCLQICLACRCSVQVLASASTPS
jgi:hypothetical protein